MSRNQKKQKRPMCDRCRTNRIEPDGYAGDGRPEYKCSKCSKCQQWHTYGLDGYDWDDRPSQHWSRLMGVEYEEDER